jgi:hypothetical protein
MITTVRGGGRFATAHTMAMGTAAEQRFYEGCREKGHAVYAASAYENRVYHFDFHVNDIRVEVKAMKSARRGLAPDPNIIYVELRNVTGGSGWLYGRADAIAFEQPCGFVVVDRVELVRVVERILPRCRRASVSGVYHTLYSRANRDDLVLVLHLDDLDGMKSKWFMRTM